MTSHPLQSEDSVLKPVAASPVRVQLSRAKGWKMPPNTVKVDRATKWGNPFVPGKPAPVGYTKGAMVQDKRHAFVLYRSMAPMNPTLIAAARAELAGKNLACWCAKDNPYEDACHAAVLLELANAPLGEASGAADSRSQLGPALGQIE